MKRKKMEGLKIKWSGKQYDISSLSETSSIEDLQTLLQQLTRVKPEHQKIFGCKFKNKSDTLKACKVTSKTKLMMMGSVVEDIEKIQKINEEEAPEIIDDFDDGNYDEFIDVCRDPIYLNKIDKRIRTYKVKIFNKPRPGSKLLVLDIDYTLFDHISPAETAYELMRPYLHEFLTRAYAQGYDIIIWSATSMKWIEAKMKILGVHDNQNYKIVCYYCHLAMIQCHLGDKGLKRVKPLGSIWGKTAGQELDSSKLSMKEISDQALSTFDAHMKNPDGTYNDLEKADSSGPNFSAFYGPKNTIMFDDVQRNFIMNPKNGLKIKAYRNAHENSATDRELVKLSDYLEAIYDEMDFSRLNMNDWKNYLKKKFDR